MHVDLDIVTVRRQQVMHLVQYRRLVACAVRLTGIAECQVEGILRRRWISAGWEAGVPYFADAEHPGGPITVACLRRHHERTGNARNKGAQQQLLAGDKHFLTPPRIGPIVPPSCKKFAMLAPRIDKASFRGHKERSRLREGGSFPGKL